MFTIHTAQPDDEEWLIALTPHLADFPLPAWRTAHAIVQADRQIIRDGLSGVLPGAAILVAELDPGAARAGKVFATTKHDCFTHEAHAHVEVIAVDAAVQERGVMRAVMGAIEQWVRDRGHPWVTLNVFKGNARARALYARLRYEPGTVHYRKAL